MLTGIKRGRQFCCRQQTLKEPVYFRCVPLLTDMIFFKILEAWTIAQVINLFKILKMCQLIVSRGLFLPGEDVWTRPHHLTKKKKKDESGGRKMEFGDSVSGMCTLSVWSPVKKGLAARSSSWFRKCSHPLLKTNFTPERKLTVVECEQCAYQTVTTHGRADDWLPRHFDIFPNPFF